MKYFGTDGIRGIPNQKLSLELIQSIGKALVTLNNSNVIVGTDTRESKDMLAYALIAGALSQGLNVEYVEVIPTPGLI
ncbi:MAG: phosphoglucosamine mutase, partial [Anaeroplasmataceae bacterium]|nr:phosphoglucosamine mutase [Anaeroplasmataceae bacterium]